MAKRTNEEWLHALRQRGAEQKEALEELRDFLFRAVLVYLRDHRTDLTDVAISDLRTMAEDFAQEALLSIRDNLDQFRGDAKFTSWAYRFVVNEAAGELRRRRYSELSLEGLSEQEAAALMSAIKSKARLDPDLAAERQDLVFQLLDIIQNELNERQRLAILGVHFQGRSMQEVADALGTSRNTLYKILHDARKRVRAKLLARHLSAGDILALFDTRW